MLPDYVTHYHVPGRRPFLNLSELSDQDWDATRQVLAGVRAMGSSFRVFGSHYFELRRATEARLRNLFVAAGGEPERDAPHYFVLGSSEWFQGLAQDMQQVVIPLLVAIDVSSAKRMAVRRREGTPMTP